jgi:hypothetical protein
MSWFIWLHRASCGGGSGINLSAIHGEENAAWYSFCNTPHFTWEYAFHHWSILTCHYPSNVRQTVPAGNISRSRPGVGTTSLTASLTTILQCPLKSSISWDITPCSPLKVNRRFGGTCRLHFQGRSISQARNQREAGHKQSLFFDPEGGGEMFLGNVGWLSTDCTAFYPRRYKSI